MTAANVSYFDLDSARSIARNFVNPQVKIHGEREKTTRSTGSSAGCFPEEGGFKPVIRKEFHFPTTNFGTQVKNEHTNNLGKICPRDKLDMQLAPRSDFNEIVVGKFLVQRA